MPPLISVILPVYNSSRYVSQAIQSILTQSYGNFEFIIVDDCSSDNTVEVIKKNTDPRIILIENTVNLGRAGSDNKAHQIASGQYIAKMDADDIAHPLRFERQVKILQSRSDINVVGTYMQNFGASTYLNKYPTVPALAKCQTLFTLPVGNPSVMMRADLFGQRKFLYNHKLWQAEDYDFFVRYMHDLKIYNIPEALIKYRTYPEDYKERILSDRASTTLEIQREMLERWGIIKGLSDLKIHECIVFGEKIYEKGISLEAVKEWLLTIKKHNSSIEWFEPFYLDLMLSKKWFDVCYHCASPGLQTLKTFHEHKDLFGAKDVVSWPDYVKFVLKKVLLGK